MDNQQGQKQWKIGSYVILRKIGQGSFGVVYQGVGEDGIHYAIKTVPKHLLQQDINTIKPMLRIQQKFLQMMQSNREIDRERLQSGIPKCYEYRLLLYGHGFVLEKPISRQEGMQEYGSKKIAHSDVLNLMWNTLKIIESVHKNGFIHRDIKPSNFMLKEKSKEKVKIYLIDYGLCKEYWKNGRHIPMKEGKKLIGTPIYCSRYTHQGKEQSRRDDIQSWLYTILSMLIVLPWQVLTVEERKENNRMYQLKQQFNSGWNCNFNRDSNKELIRDSKEFIHEGNYKGQSINMLNSKDAINKLEHKGELNRKYDKVEIMPQCMAQIFKYVNSLEFEDQPNYLTVYQLIQNEYWGCYERNIDKDELGLKLQRINRKLVSQQTLNGSNQKKQVKVKFKIDEKKIKKIEKKMYDANDNIFEKIMGDH